MSNEYSSKTAPAVPRLSRRLALSLMASGAVTAGSAHAGLLGGGGKKGPDAIAIGTAEAGKAQAQTLINRLNKRAVPAGARIMPPFFQVEIIDEMGKTVDERKYRGGAQVTSKFTVDGIDTSAVQALVDRLHAQFLAELIAAGYQIVPQAQAESNANWGKVMAAVKPSPLDTKTAGGGHSIFYAPTGSGVYITPGDPRFGVLSVFGNGGPAFAEQAIPREMGTTLMGVELAVGFVEIKSQGGEQYSNLFGTGYASVEGKAVMSIIPERTRLWFYQAPETYEVRQSLSLARPVVPAKSPIIAFDDVTSNGSKASDIAGTLLGSLSGGGKTYQTKAFKITLDRAAFPPALEGCLSGITSAMVERLRTL